MSLPKQNMRLQVPVSPKKMPIDRPQFTININAGAPKSPIKKHLQHAAASAAIVTRATNPDQRMIEGEGNAPVVTTAMARASVVHVMMSLLDHDQATLEGIVPILQALAQMPLGNRHVRGKCFELLRDLQLHLEVGKPINEETVPSESTLSSCSEDVSISSCSSCRQTAYYMAPSFVYEHPTVAETSTVTHPQNSGRVKSLNLHHCKEFLLACANEIHDLEEENPAFDYAETCSEAGQSTRQQIAKQHEKKKRKNCTNPCGQQFDYASTVDSVSYRGKDDDDELDGIQGSQFSEVVRRAESLRDVPMSNIFQQRQKAIQSLRSIHNRMLCRQALTKIQHHTTSNNSNSVKALMLKYRVFVALKRNAHQSSRNLRRKQHVFQQLKHRVVQRQRMQFSVPRPLPSVTTTMGFHLHLLMHKYADMLLLVLIAFLLQIMMV